MAIMRPHLIPNTKELDMRLLMAILLASFSMASLASGATNALSQYKSYENSLLSNFGSGRVIRASNDGTTRWILYNEGMLGYSYSKLGDTFLHSADIGYSTYIMSVSSMRGVYPYVGVEITVPIYIKQKGDSNAFATDPTAAGLPNGTKLLGEMGFNGWGVQVPVVIGLQMKSFYIQAMGGYAYHSIKDVFYKSATENDWSLTNTYQGIIYGAGLGVRLKNTFSAGLRFIMGDLNSTLRDPEQPGLQPHLRAKDFQSPYWRASVIFGVCF